MPYVTDPVLVLTSLRLVYLNFSLRFMDDINEKLLLLFHEGAGGPRWDWCRRGMCGRMLGEEAAKFSDYREVQLGLA